ncbi:MAG: formylglycine-generating enzyme family protein [Nitrospiraceae bacterium]
MVFFRFRCAALRRVTMIVPVLLWLISSGPCPAESDQAVADAAPLQEQLTGRDGAPLILIPAGRFLMGSETGEADEQPIHPIELDAFYIDKYEITVSRYARFLHARRPEQPFLWAQAARRGQGRKPVIGVDWFDAKEYCEWIGRRLPTEAEWERAARGDDQRIYPWGNEPPTGLHVVAGLKKWTGYDTLGVVGSHPQGGSSYGVEDLAGNVWEWIADRYDEQYYRESPGHNPQGPTRGPLRVLRGGAWNNNAATIRSANRAAYAPSARRNDAGFRCAMNAD